jgi:hypothetical protein
VDIERTNRPPDGRWPASELPLNGCGEDEETGAHATTC